ncbi:MAG: hypothetical protein AB8G16_13730 [Gammaproteobacteria bacterium]
MTKSLHHSLTQVQRTLSEQTAALDADNARALRLARERALNAASQRSWRLPLLLGGVAASVVALSIVLRLGTSEGPSDRDIVPDAAIADLDVLTQDDDLSLIEDLEFLAWLLAQDEDVT